MASEFRMFYGAPATQTANVETSRSSVFIASLHFRPPLSPAVSCLGGLGNASLQRSLPIPASL